MGRITKGLMTAALLAALAIPAKADNGKADSILEADSLLAKQGLPPVMQWIRRSIQA